MRRSNSKSGASLKPRSDRQALVGTGHVTKMSLPQRLLSHVKDGPRVLPLPDQAS